ncbi:response regulator [Chitinispirillales bacterium ANBcel5]|uniref:response regulator n=1 Tax=Cellulosispirillum alkaliphilum TaxID=3039283 RepID=UPI002A569FF3|nr:response regulator [Chitinispirillales bacterium ANBcel5]
MNTTTGKTILIVEDSATQRERLRHVLKKRGHEVLAAKNGKDALLKLQSEPIDLIVSDIMMPDMNGYELTQKIKASTSYSKVPVILVTALTDPQDVINGLKSGADNFITKPYSDAYLVSRIESIFDYKGTMEEPEEIEINYAGQKYTVSAGRMQTINLLLSTYENAIQKNQELDRANQDLIKAKRDLQHLNTKLENQSSLLQTIFDSIPVMLSIYDPDTGTYIINKFIIKVTGWTDQDSQSQDFLEKLFPDPHYREKMLESMDSSEPNFTDLKLCTKSGDLIQTSWATVTIEDGRRIGIGLDIRERKKMELKLKKHAKDLAYANEELKSFSYSVSHDLRSPLRAVSGFSELLLEDYADKLDKTAKEYLDHIINGTKKMNSLIDDMLSLSRVSNQEMDSIPLNLSELARSVIEDLKRMEPNRDVSVNIEENLQTTGDPNLIRLALSNLLRNAWKYTAKVEQPLIEFGCICKDRQHIYFVRDNGAGFDMNYAEKLFAPFGRLHSGSEFPGTGIGLAIVKRVINRHNGDVWAQSEENRGATFYFTIRL